EGRLRLPPGRGAGVPGDRRAQEARRGGARGPRADVCAASGDGKDFRRDPTRGVSEELPHPAELTVSRPVAQNEARDWYTVASRNGSCRVPAAPAALRVHHHLPLSLSPAHVWARDADRGHADHGAT